MFRHEGILFWWIFRHGSADTQPQQTVPRALSTQKITEVDLRSDFQPTEPPFPSPDVTSGNTQLAVAAEMASLEEEVGTILFSQPT